MLKFLYKTKKSKYLNINKKFLIINIIKKLKRKNFFLKVWAQNVDVPYTWEHVIHGKTRGLWGR